MSRKFLEMLNGDRKGPFSRFLAKAGPEPAICWYPSAGQDFRDVLYLDPAYARLHPAREPEESFPDVFIHTDLDAHLLDRFQEDTPILLDDGRTGISVEIDTMDALPPLKIDDPAPWHDPRHGNVLHFRLNVDCSVRDRQRDDEQTLQDFRFDPDTDRWHRSYKAHVVHVCIENSAFLRRMLESRASLTHAYEYCLPTLEFGGPTYQHLDDRSAYLPWLGCRHLVTVGAEKIPPHWRTIRSRSGPYDGAKVDWLKTNRWDRHRFLEHIRQEDPEFVFWGLGELTEQELQDLIDHCCEKDRFKSVLIPLIKTNLFLDRFEAVVLPRVLGCLVSRGRMEMVVELLGLQPDSNASRRLVASELRVLPAREALTALDRCGCGSNGLLDYEEVARDRSEEWYDALKSWPSGIRHFDADRIPREVRDELDAELRRMVLRMRLWRRGSRRRKWYQVEIRGHRRDGGET